MSKATAEATHEERCWRIGGPVTLDQNGTCPECGWSYFSGEDKPYREGRYAFWTDKPIESNPYGLQGRKEWENGWKAAKEWQHQLLIDGTEAHKAGQPIESNPYNDYAERAAWERGWNAHKTQLQIGPGQTGLDPEVAELVWAMNKLPGIETRNSCSGHGREPFMIWFDVTDYQARGLLVLSRLLSHNYHAFHKHFRVVLDHSDSDPQVCWRLESCEYRGIGVLGVAELADEMAHKINAIVDDTIEHYNILYDRRGGGGA